MATFSPAEIAILHQVALNQFISTHLDIREVLVLQMSLQGLSPSEIATHQRCHRSLVHLVKRSIATKFRSFLSTQTPHP